MSRNTMSIDISTSLYSKEAIINAINKFTDKFYVTADPIPDSKISISFSAKDNSTVSKDIIGQFYNELADQQMRINVEREYKTIREEIVRKAFSPINKH